VNFYDFRARQASRVPDDIEDLAYQAIGAAIEVHRVLGPGLAEIHYQRALSHELTLRGIPHSREQDVDILYKGAHIGQRRLDFIVADRLILELKASEGLTDVDRAQAITYLPLKKLPLALLINFNVAILKDGIKRVINTR
jgi:GxxExxY protein